MHGGGVQMSGAYRRLITHLFPGRSLLVLVTSDLQEGPLSDIHPLANVANADYSKFSLFPLGDAVRNLDTPSLGKAILKAIPP